MLKTVTYNTDTHKIVPIALSEDQIFVAKRFFGFDPKSRTDQSSLMLSCYQAMLSAAPEFEGEKE